MAVITVVFRRSVHERHNWTEIVSISPAAVVPAKRLRRTVRNALAGRACCLERLTVLVWESNLSFGTTAPSIRGEL